MRIVYCSIGIVLLQLIGCDTVDLGDNFIAPEVELDPNIFFCRIQPEILTQYHCAPGDSDEQGSCHSAKSALRLQEPTETLACNNGIPATAAPESFRANLENIRFTVRDDAPSSPLYRRPLKLDNHPREIFKSTDPAAQLILDWIGGAAK